MFGGEKKCVSRLAGAYAQTALEQSSEALQFQSLRAIEEGRKGVVLELEVTLSISCAQKSGNTLTDSLPDS